MINGPRSWSSRSRSAGASSRPRPISPGTRARACGAGDSVGAPSRARPAGDRPLKDAFAQNFLIGAAIEPAQLANAPDVALLETHFNSITAENVMKPRTLAPTAGAYDFAAADRL